MYNKNKRKIALILPLESSHENKTEQYLLVQGYECIRAESELEALSLLAYKKIDIIVSNQNICTQNSRQPVVIFKPRARNTTHQTHWKLAS